MSNNNEKIPPLIINVPGQQNNINVTKPNANPIPLNNQQNNQQQKPHKKAKKKDKKQQNQQNNNQPKKQAQPEIKRLKINYPHSEGRFSDGDLTLFATLGKRNGEGFVNKGLLKTKAYRFTITAEASGGKKIKEIVAYILLKNNEIKSVRIDNSLPKSLSLPISKLEGKCIKAVVVCTFKMKLFEEKTLKVKLNFGLC